MIMMTMKGMAKNSISKDNLDQKIITSTNAKIADNNINSSSSSTTTKEGVEESVAVDDEEKAMRSKTRVCIKQLPSNMTEEKLRRHLLSCPAAAAAATANLAITDCRIVRTKSGKSRHMAYVGFKEASMASRVVSYFHNSFLQTNRILVEPAFLPKANKKEEDTTVSLSYRPWSKYSVGSSKYAKLHPITTTSSNTEEENEPTASHNTANTKEEEEIERKKQEFLSVMQSRTRKGKTWSNDDDFVAGTLNNTTYTTSTTTTTTTAKNAVQVSSNNNSENAAAAATITTTNAANENVEDPPKDISKEQKKDSQQTHKMSNMDFLRSKVISKEELSEEEEEEEEEEENLVSEDDDSSSSTNTSSSQVSPSNNNPSTTAHYPIIIMEEDNAQAQQQQRQKEEKEEEELDVAKHTIISAEEEEEDIQKKKKKNHQDPTRLFVRNLPFHTTVEELRQVFQPFGPIVDVHIPIDDLKRNKGFAFIQYEDAQAASTALSKLDATDFQGRLMHILIAQKAITSTTVEDDATTNYRSRKEAERKNTAATATTGWNTNFVRGDAVVEGLAQRLGLRKGDILNVTADGLSSGDAAVRLALGETHVINENIEYFASHGIDMTSLLSAATSSNSSSSSNNKKRSSTKILVKNLPYSDNTEQELMKVFTSIPRGAEPTQILVPPSRAVAIITYSHENDAKRAFRTLAYKRFKNVPLYLEWAPLAAFSSSGESNNNSKSPSDSSGKDTTSVGAPVTNNDNTANVKSVTAKEVVATDHDDENDDDDGVAYSIYVKNLNFATREESLQKLFETIIPVRTVRIPTKVAPQKAVLQHQGLPSSANEVRHQSMGFGFVECHNAHDAKKAIKELQGKLLEGYALELSLSNKKNKTVVVGNNSSGKKKQKKKTAKLLVRNVPFEATRNELYKLFGSYGSLKQVRLPKKMDGSHRGFAFVEYVSAEDAENAMVKLSGTHLYGRHLVLAWSDDTEEEDIVLETLRDKAKRDLQQHQQMSATIAAPVAKNKKIRFDS